uniref:NADH-ubiquinone oxidoreductase chain 2 n=1 Tax=Opimothrips tubulatus TaxID=2724111 RepID=A0A9E9ES81_9NEOP|nr:NADH dehydrogenase subunit 2 [Opimothrips tubulatus]WAO28724.1 NADH dehydrogenase subunit 2 [Opimothrips tubulatus]
MLLKNMGMFSSWYMFFFLLIMSVLMSMSCNSVLWVWLSMELNSMFFLPLLNSFNNFLNLEQMMKFFFIQSISSSFLFFLIFFFYVSNNMNFFKMKSIFLMIMFLKMGTAPFHFWALHMMENFELMALLIFLTIQKLIPLTFIILNFDKLTMFVFSMLNSFFGSIMGLSQFSLKKMIMFSSLNHLSWILISISLSMKLFKFYIYLYFLMVFFQILFIKMNKILFIYQIFFHLKNSVKPKFNKNNPLFFLMMYFMGLPPMIGFFPKFFIILKSNEFLTMIILFMIFMTLMSFVFYTRMILTILLNSIQMTKFLVIYNFKNKTLFYLNMFLVSMFMSFLFFFEKTI